MTIKIKNITDTVSLLLTASFAFFTFKVLYTQQYSFFYLIVMLYFLISLSFTNASLILINSLNDRMRGAFVKSAKESSQLSLIDILCYVFFFMSFIMVFVVNYDLTVAIINLSIFTLKITEYLLILKVNNNSQLTMELK